MKAGFYRGGFIKPVPAVAKVWGVRLCDQSRELAAQNNYPLMKSMVMAQVADHFRPEFINRIDEVVVFHPLGREQIRAIADIQIGYLRAAGRPPNGFGGH